MVTVMNFQSSLEECKDYKPPREERKSGEEDGDQPNISWKERILSIQCPTCQEIIDGIKAFKDSCVELFFYNSCSNLGHIILFRFIIISTIVISYFISVAVNIPLVQFFIIVQNLVIWKFPAVSYSGITIAEKEGGLSSNNNHQSKEEGGNGMLLSQDSQSKPDFGELKQQEQQHETTHPVTINSIIQQTKNTNGNGNGGMMNNPNSTPTQATKRLSIFEVKGSYVLEYDKFVSFCGLVKGSISLIILLAASNQSSLDLAVFFIALSEKQIFVHFLILSHVIFIIFLEK